MYNEQLHKLIQIVVDQHPHPVRTFRGSRFWSIAILNRTVLILMGQLMFVFLLGVYVLYNPTVTRGGVFIGGFMIFGGTFGVFNVLWRYLILIQILRYGQMVSAKVVDVKLMERGQRRYNTLLPRGLAIGQWKIMLGDRVITKRFEIDVPWNQRIRDNSEIQVLFYPFLGSNVYPLRLLKK
jgi:hypothetical protein